MFFQICLLTAGVHYGRKLWKSWHETPADPSYLTPPGLHAESSSIPDAIEVVTESQSSNIVRTAAAHTDEEAAINEQLGTAIVATGLTSAASLYWPKLRLLGGTSVMYGSIPIFEKAKHQIVEERRIGIEVLDSIGLIASIAARQYTISAVMFLLYAGAQKLRLKTESLSRQSMLDVFGRQPESVWTIQDGVEVSVPLGSLQAGDIVVVGAGEAIPVDGVVTEGFALVDQRMLTGESVLADKAVGDEVFAMTIVSSGKLHVRVVMAGSDTTAEKISNILQNTADFASSVELEGKRIADASALPILALGTLSAPVVGAKGSIALLNIGIADNMRVIAPFSMLNYLRKAYDTGILLKDGRSLQLLPQVDTVVFDKTGTLTEERLRVRGIYTVSAAGEEEVLAGAAAVEQRQTHPIAQAIIEEAERRGYTVPPVAEASYEIGYGLGAKVGKQQIRVGSKRFIVSLGLAIPGELARKESEIFQHGNSLVYVARDDVAIGLIELEPLLRPESSEVIRALKERELSIYLLSGDQEEPTRAMAELLGLDGYFAEVLPADKARIVGELTEQGKHVCFVGDGINDAIALKRATVSVSMIGASAVAIDNAQVTLMEHGLGKLPELFTIASDFQSNMHGILLSAVIPAAAAVGGVFLAGFSTNAVAACYFASMVSGLGIAMWPHRNSYRRGQAMVEVDQEG